MCAGTFSARQHACVHAQPARHLLIISVMIIMPSCPLSSRVGSRTSCPLSSHVGFCTSAIAILCHTRLFKSLSLHNVQRCHHCCTRRGAMYSATSMRKHRTVQQACTNSRSRDRRRKQWQHAVEEHEGQGHDQGSLCSVNWRKAIVIGGNV